MVMALLWYPRYLPTALPLLLRPEGEAPLMCEPVRFPFKAFSSPRRGWARLEAAAFAAFAAFAPIA